MTDPIVERNKRNFRRLQEEVIAGGDTTALPELMAPTVGVLRAANDSLTRLNGGEIPDERVMTLEQFIQHQEATDRPATHRRTIEEINGEGDVVWARWKIEVEHFDDRYGIPPTGTLLVFTEIGRIRFDDKGRMIEGWFMSDPLDALNQIGSKLTVPAGWVFCTRGQHRLGLGRE